MRVYQYHNDKLCVCLNGLVEVGYDNLKPLERKRGSKVWTEYPLWNKWRKHVKECGGYTRPGGNGRESLIELEYLPPKYREDIREKYPQSKIKAKSNSLLARIERDEKAASFYLTHEIAPKRTLPEKHKKNYTANACILNAVKEIKKSNLTAKIALGGSVKNFWTHMSRSIQDIQDEFPHSLPKNPTSLKRLYTKYLKQGYIALVSGKFCNDNSEKITTEIENWLIKELAMTRQSVEMIYLRYPLAAEQNGWDPTITSRAFQKRAATKRVQQLVDLSRYGREGFRKKHGFYHGIRKAKYSNDVWFGDGTGTGWVYRTENNDIGYATTYFVMDSVSGKFLSMITKEGIGGEDRHMQSDAFRAALRNTGYAKPFEVKLDNQKGHKTKEMKALMSQMAHVVTFSKPKRSSGRAIESKFGQFQRMKLSEFPFWSGFGRQTHSTLENAPLPREVLKKRIDQIPSFDELLQLLDVIVDEWNNMNYKGRPSPNEIYEEQKNPDQKYISVDQLSEMFWNIQGPRPFTKNGIYLIYQGEKKKLDVYDENGNVDFHFRRKYLGERLYLKYDPEQEFEEVELLIAHPTGKYEMVATAQARKDVSETVKYLEKGEKQWAVDQLQGEEDFMDDLENELEKLGINEEVKFNSWKDRLYKKPKVMSNGEDEDLSDEDLTRKFYSEI
jgi:hypothetical protein